MLSSSTTPPTHTPTHTHICICTCICIYMYVCVCIREFSIETRFLWHPHNLLHPSIQPKLTQTPFLYTPNLSLIGHKAGSCAQTPSAATAQFFVACRNCKDKKKVGNKGWLGFVRQVRKAQGAAWINDPWAWTYPVPLPSLCVSTEYL